MSVAATALHSAVEANRFGVMHVHNLKETMAKKGVEFAHECLIFEVCQPRHPPLIFWLILPAAGENAPYRRNRTPRNLQISHHTITKTISSLLLVLLDSPIALP